MKNVSCNKHTHTHSHIRSIIDFLLCVIYCEFIRITFSSLLFPDFFFLFLSSSFSSLARAFFLRSISSPFLFPSLSSSRLLFFPRFVLNVRSVYDSQSIRRHCRRRSRLFVVTIKHSLTFLDDLYMPMNGDRRCRQNRKRRERERRRERDKHATHDNIYCSLFPSSLISSLRLRRRRRRRRKKRKE